jgi:hypothetical protein
MSDGSETLPNMLNYLQVKFMNNTSRHKSVSFINLMRGSGFTSNISATANTNFESNIEKFDVSLLNGNFYWYIIEAAFRKIPIESLF